MLKADDFAPRSPTPSVPAKRISPMGADLTDDPPTSMKRHGRAPASPRSQSAFASAIAAAEASTEEENKMPRGVYDRSKSKPRAKSADTGDAAAPGDASTAKSGKKRQARKAKARAVKAATRPHQAKESFLAGRRFARWDDGSIDINLPDCSGHLSAKEAEELLAFLSVGGRRAR